MSPSDPSGGTPDADEPERSENSEESPLQDQASDEFTENALPRDGAEVVKASSERRLREVTRSRLAVVLVVLLAVVVMTFIVAAMLNLNVAAVERVIASILPPLFGLVATSTGFYYARER